MLSVFLDPGYEFDGFFAGSYALAATALGAALLVASATMSIHSIETILDRRRSMSGLVALGASPRDLQRSQVLEAALVGVTSAAAGYVVGAVTFLPVARPGAQGVALIVGLGVGIVAMVRLGVFASVRATTPWLNRAVSSDNLRRE
jgi:ABC-type antimicrobial peptide transport system permease subunit